MRPIAFNSWHLAACIHSKFATFPNIARYKCVGEHFSILRRLSVQNTCTARTSAQLASKNKSRALICRYFYCCTLSAQIVVFVRIARCARYVCYPWYNDTFRKKEEVIYFELWDWPVKSFLLLFFYLTNLTRTFLRIWRLELPFIKRFRGKIRYVIAPWLRFLAKVLHTDEPTFKFTAWCSRSALSHISLVRTPVCNSQWNPKPMRYRQHRCMHIRFHSKTGQKLTWWLCVVVHASQFDHDHSGFFSPDTVAISCH